MAARGRPAKTLTQNDLDALKFFLSKLPFLKKNQERAVALLQESSGPFDEEQVTLLKTVDREIIRFQQRIALLEQIKLKQKNKQKLLANEIEILDILSQIPDQDNFFRLDRALESYQKIEKAALENRIRLEGEQRRELLNKTSKQMTEAQKKRNAENQMKYALGGAVLSAWKQLKLPIEDIDPQKVEKDLVHSISFLREIRGTQLYNEVYNVTNNHVQTKKLLPELLDALMKYNTNNEYPHQIELKKLYQSQ